MRASPTHIKKKLAGQWPSFRDDSVRMKLRINICSCCGHGKLPHGTPFRDDPDAWTKFSYFYLIFFIFESRGRGRTTSWGETKDQPKRTQRTEPRQTKDKADQLPCQESKAKIQTYNQVAVNQNRNITIPTTIRHESTTSDRPDKA